MTPKSMNLNKLLKLLQLRDQPLISELRKELRAERDKILREGISGGGDFHGAFWSDAKLHVRGVVNLRNQTQFRIDRSKQRQRLYPMLASGFLGWLEELKRTTNQRVGWHEDRVHNHHLFEDLDLTLKVDNLLSLRIGDDVHRLVYPYFSEIPVLSAEWARVGLWAMAEALEAYSITEMEILDVLRGRGFRGSRIQLRGNEEVLFARRYSEVLLAWDELRPEYDL